MPRSPTHRVHEWVIELRTDEAGAATLRKRASRLQPGLLIPVLERACRRLGGGTRPLRLDVLKLDLGPLPWEGFEQRFLSALEDALLRGLRGAVRKEPAGETWRGQLELIEAFAGTGNVPPGADAGRRDLVSAALRDLLNNESARREWVPRLRRLGSEPTALGRLLTESDAETLGRLAGRLGPGLEALAARLTASALGRACSPTELRELWWVVLVSAVHGAEALENPGEPELQTQRREQADFFVQMVFASRVARRRGWRRDAIAAAVGLRFPTAGAPSRRAARLLRRVERGSATAGLPARETRRPFVPADWAAAGVPVRNAGLVLLWPFLPQLFERCELTRDEAFVGRPARARAVALLEHLTRARPDAPEFFLPLDKLVCGLAPEEPLAIRELPAPRILAAGDRLLNAVIARARVLGEMPASSLRARFLTRGGKLEARPAGWLLRVERRDRDQVLDALPWSWSWVALPWMTTPLQVIW